MCIQSISLNSDARKMARDVHDMLLETIREQGEKTTEQALSVIKRLETQKRYQADVWT